MSSGKLCHASTSRNVALHRASPDAYVAPRLPSHGFAATLDEAKTAFAETRRRWLALAGGSEDHPPTQQKSIDGIPSGSDEGMFPRGHQSGKGLSQLPRSHPKTQLARSSLML
jgi:hypothetical protein